MEWIRPTSPAASEVEYSIPAGSQRAGMPTYPKASSRTDGSRIGKNRRASSRELVSSVKRSIPASTPRKGPRGANAS